MPRIECAHGFSCAMMLFEPGLEAENCPNKDECGTISRLEEGETVTLTRCVIINNIREYRTYSYTAREVAELMLHSRGCPQNAESLGLTDSIQNLRSQIALLEETIEELTNNYVAPPQVEAHAYNVKRGYGTYYYNKLSSTEPIFEPSIKSDKVKVIHLSKTRDYRNIIGRMGIEARNRLISMNKQIINCTNLLQQTRETIQEVSLEQAVIVKLENYEQNQEEE